MDIISKSDIEDAFRGKLWTYVPVVAHGHKIGIAVANEAGYTPVPYNMTRDCGDRYDEQKVYCNALNAERGQTEAQSLDIICSSMAQGKTTGSRRGDIAREIESPKSRAEYQAEHDRELARDGYENDDDFDDMDYHNASTEPCCGG